MNHILHYIRGTLTDKLTYRRQDRSKAACKIVTMADSSYADDKRDYKSHTGALGFVFGCLVWWLSRRQKMVATSTFMAETMAQFEASREIVWLRKLLEDLDMAEEGPSML